MQIVDRGSGVPLVLIPGIQGRWEYMRPAIDALELSFRVITFPLCGERGSDCRFVPADGLEHFVDQIDRVLDDRRLASAMVAGVSFGGLIALHYAAKRAERAAALVLVSTPGPDFRPSPRHARYARSPTLLGPVFLAEIPGRVREELERALPEGRERQRFAWRQMQTFFKAPLSLRRMAERSRVFGDPALAADSERISVPTLVITGEPGLDRVVPVSGTLEYARLIRGARSARIERTGHLGYITKPDVFAALVHDFTRSCEGGTPRKMKNDAA